jgi:nucleoside-diphosphate-sugar epimerase
MKIAILGASSHIAKGLIANFLKAKGNHLYLFSRTMSKLEIFLHLIGKSSKDLCLKEGYNDFNKENYDLIINCVGAGTPNKLKNNYSNWFSVNEKFDNIAIDYLHNNPKTLYINFSSGAVYGKNGSAPVEENTLNSIPVNNLQPEDYYSIANLNSEAKHRSFKDLKIVDIRIFSYFSRFADLNSGYFITEVMKHVLEKKTLETTDVNIVRDYIDPDDLFALILKCVEFGKINSAFDAVSRQSVDKLQILEYVLHLERILNFHLLLVLLFSFLKPFYIYLI